MPADVAKQLAAFGTEFDGESRRPDGRDLCVATARLCTGRNQGHEGLAYGPARAAAGRRSHRDGAAIRRPGARRRRTSRRRPDRRQPRGVGERRRLLREPGIVGVNGGYRLAPDAQWPEGGRDVGAAVTWLQSHAVEYGGDPEQIFVVGSRPGPARRDMVFRPELLLPRAARPAGTILLSGPSRSSSKAPSPGELAYFGEDPSALAGERDPGPRHVAPTFRCSSPPPSGTTPRYLSRRRRRSTTSWSTSTGRASLPPEPGTQPFVAAVVGRLGRHERVARDRGFHRTDGETG